MSDSNFDKMCKDGTFQKVSAYANSIVGIATTLHGPERTGGVMTFFEQGNPLLVQFPVGVMIPEKEEVYRKFSLEKPKRGFRLRAKNSYIDADHNPAEGRYAGAFFISSLGFWSSFSGLDQFDDVSFNAHCLLHERVITRAQMLIIFLRHGDEVSRDLRFRQAEIAKMYCS